VWMTRGKPEEAVIAYAGALALRPDLADAHMGLAAAYLSTGDRALAAEHARRFLELAPDSRVRPQLETIAALAP
jgi:Flp pilus assembly protein TadD